MSLVVLAHPQGRAGVGLHGDWLPEVPVWSWAEEGRMRERKQQLAWLCWLLCPQGQPQCLQAERDMAQI